MVLGDPMFQALFENLLKLEHFVESLRDSCVLFMRGVEPMCEGAKKLADVLVGTFGSDPDRGVDVNQYRDAINYISHGAGSSCKATLIDDVTMLVLDPLNMHLEVWGCSWETQWRRHGTVIDCLYSFLRYAL